MVTILHGAQNRKTQPPQGDGCVDEVGSLTEIIEIAGAKKLAGDEGGTNLIGMNTGLCNVGGVTVLEIAVEHGVQIDKGHIVLLAILRQIAP